jgi:hypothetical protein
MSMEIQVLTWTGTKHGRVKPVYETHPPHLVLGNWISNSNETKIKYFLTKRQVNLRSVLQEFSAEFK